MEQFKPYGRPPRKERSDRDRKPREMRPRAERPERDFPREDSPRDNRTEQGGLKSEIVYGKNPVTELLKSGTGVDTVLLSDGLAPAVAAYYTAMAKDVGAVVKRVNPNKLRAMTGTESHQGVAAFANQLCNAGRFVEHCPGKGRTALPGSVGRHRRSPQSGCGDPQCFAVRRTRRGHPQARRCRCDPHCDQVQRGRSRASAGGSCG